MMETITVSSRGQIVIPEQVRRHLRLTKGSRLVLFEQEGTILLKKEEQVTKHLEEQGNKEIAGWIALAERSLHDIWDNPADEEMWKRYL